MITIPSISLKQDVITDLKYKSYILADYSSFSSEKMAIKHILANFNEFKKQAQERHFPQIQVKFPHSWNKFSETIEEFGLKKGLFFVERKIDKNSLDFAHGTQIISDTLIIKKPLIIQQKLHYDLNPDFFDDIKTFNLENYLGEIQESIDDGSGIIFGTFKRKKLTGFIVLEKSDPGYYISELFVNSKYRGLGLGRKLFTVANDYAKKEESGIIWTTLSTENLEAMRFYEKLGFKVTTTLNYLNLVHGIE